MLTVFGTIALDTTRTPFKTETKILGGAATYASLSSSLLYPTSIVAVIGSDFPSSYMGVLQSRLDTKGIIIKKDGKTFHYDSSFDFDLAHRVANRTDLNVIANFKPVIPESYIDSEYVYLGNNDPVQNMEILELFSGPKLTLCDTIEYWIINKKDDVIKMMSKVDGVIINDDEARLLCKTPNLIKCAKSIMKLGPHFVIIKKGEHGSIFFYEDTVFPAPAYPLEEIIDPTGAGDSFAGGFIGHIARRGSTGLDILKEAVVYGNVLGAYAVEDFGVKKLLGLSMNDVESRYIKYKKIVQF